MRVARHLSGLLLLIAFVTVQAQEIPAGPELRAELSELVLNYAYYRDVLEADAVADLFTADATMTVLGQTYTGRAAIRQRIADARSNAEEPVTRHLMSTQRFFQSAADRARGVSYVAVLGAPQQELPIRSERFLAVGEYHDEFVRTSQGWKIARREFVYVFDYRDQP
ncbi:MAG: nuclear transport factor 2 family protein [Pseudomonadota bacterium]